MTSFDPLVIRRRLGRKEWGAPFEFGPDGWLFDHRDEVARIIVSAADWRDGRVWIHASISRPVMPTYEDLCLMHRAVWPDGWAYQVFAPPSDHVNIHDRALHLWGRPDGSAVLPNFGMYGSI